MNDGAMVKKTVEVLREATCSSPLVQSEGMMGIPIGNSSFLGTSGRNHTRTANSARAIKN